MTDKLQEKILAYIQIELLDDDEDMELGADDDLLIDELIDSMGVMRLISFIEEDLGLSVPPEDVTIENFATVSAISSYLEELQQSAE